MASVREILVEKALKEIKGSIPKFLEENPELTGDQAVTVLALRLAVEAMVCLSLSASEDGVKSLAEASEPLSAEYEADLRASIEALEASRAG